MNTDFGKALTKSIISYDPYFGGDPLLWTLALGWPQTRNKDCMLFCPGCCISPWDNPRLPDSLSPTEESEKVDPTIDHSKATFKSLKSDPFSGSPFLDPPLGDSDR